MRPALLKHARSLADELAGIVNNADNLVASKLSNQNWNFANRLIDALKSENACMLFTIAKLHEYLSKWPRSRCWVARPKRNLAKSRDVPRPRAQPCPITARFVLGLVHSRCRLDIFANLVQDFKVSGVSKGDHVLGFTIGYNVKAEVLCPTFGASVSTL